jgi:GT2 family glycosyltransferase
MTGASAYAIVCTGGGPRAAAGLRARFAAAEFRYVGPPGAAPYGVVADDSLAAALRAVEAEISLVVDPALMLDPAAASALAEAAAHHNTVVAPVVLDPLGQGSAASSLLVADPARGRARTQRLDPGDVATAPAFDGRCVAARTETLRRIAPAHPDAAGWFAATAAARSAGVRLLVAAVPIRPEPDTGWPECGDDPRRASAESRLAAHASPWWSGFAAEATSRRATRTLRTFYGADLAVADPAPRATAVVVGTPQDRSAFETALHANGLRLDTVSYAVGAQAQAVADAALRNRGDRYVAFVDAGTELQPGWLDALVAALECDPLAAFATFAPAGIDARATVVAAARIPECDRLEPFETLHGALADLALRVARERGRGIVRVADALAALPPRIEDTIFRTRYGCAPADAQVSLVATAPRFGGIASIIMLSWNAPEFTRMAVESIHAVTCYPHEIIVVDNGSDAATCVVLAGLEAQFGVRVVYNGRNLGFGAGMNVGLAHARGDVLVLLNNDVIVTEGWLEDLVGALERRRGVGCTAPRSNRVASAAQVEAQYVDISAMHRWAAERRRVLHGRGHYAERVVGFCMCLDRKVIEGIGGFDPRYGIGNFEDDDLSVRIRAAGWQMFVCDDVFIHHFGSASFKANAVDYRDLMETNWRTFCHKWGLGELALYTPYDPRALARGGFEPDAHYIALPDIA